jgi:zinc protease
MKTQFLSLILILFLFTACNQTGKQFKTIKKTDTKGYQYEYVENDPLKTRIYTLENGLKVYLTPNPDEPRVTCLIGVRAGSTSDPIETTGLAHYFEHMMFKGTEKLGTTNWEEESKLIAQLEDLFEKHRASSDPDEKKELYKQIDKISFDAAKYVATNEYDKLMTSIGTKNTNAGTSYEMTVYINDVPVNELEKWAIIESERFRGIVLRLFHTELETVYEEFNMYQDMDSERASQTMMSNLFPNHPYGRSIIGLPEHIKNPSMINIKQFFETFYVPNNMAVILSGDINYEETITLIDKHFGSLQYKELPKIDQPKEQPIMDPVVSEVLGPEPENVTIAFRMGGVGSDDQAMVTLIDMLLANSQAGLIDLDLVQNQKVLSATSYYYVLKDYGIQILQGNPRNNQTLEEVKDLLLSQLEKLKNGEFDEWLMQATINDLKLNKIRQQERNMGRAFELMGEFVDGLSREESLRFFEKMEKIKKDDIVEFAKNRYSDNYVVVYKRQGDNSALIKVEKPQITPITINRDLMSDFARNFNEIKPQEVAPVFIDFNEQIAHSEIKKGCDLYYIKNDFNELFSLDYILDMGSWHDLKFELAVGYLKFIGTEKFSAPDFQKELYKYGLSLNVSTGEERSYVTVKGLNSSFDKGLELLEHLLAQAKADKDAYAEYVSRILKERADQKADQNTILWQAMYDYGMYGAQSPKKHILSEQELLEIDPEELVALIKAISTYEHKIFYFGPTELSKIKGKISKNLRFSDEPKKIADVKQFERKKNEKSKVYVVDYDINQANILLVANGESFSKELIPYARIYNEFYGSGLSSVVFQEIRESKALAYAAYSGYSVANKPNRLNTLTGFLGTQSDKLSIATETLIGLMNQMPEATDQFNVAKEAIIKKINTERITRDRIFWSWLRNMDRGIDYDIRKDEYEAAKNMSPEEFQLFFDRHIKGQNYNFLILGKKSNFDNKALQKLGEVEELSLTDLFGY